MSWFKHRKGYRKLRDEILLGDLDAGTRNRLWTLLMRYYWDSMRGIPFLRRNENMEKLFVQLWFDYFKLPHDTLTQDWQTLYSDMRERFFGGDWFEALSFIEAVLFYHPDESLVNEFSKLCNGILEKDKSGYRLVGGKFVEITSEEEISTIEEALNIPLKNVKTHLEQSLSLLSDKKNPDYRNSIKESISAIEAICITIVGTRLRTFHLMLDDVAKKLGINNALVEGFKRIYGYTSDQDGIRHALMDEPTLGYEDALYMLISCSAFINYLINKATKQGIKL